MGMGEELGWGWVKNWDGDELGLGWELEWVRNRDRGGSGIEMRMGSGSGIDTGQELTKGWIRNCDRGRIRIWNGDGSELGWGQVRN